MSRAALLLTVANVTGGMLGYVYQVIMGRVLGAADFALFSAISALIMFIVSPLNAMFMIISRRVTIMRVHLHYHALRRFYWKSGVAVLVGGVALIPLIFLFSTDVQGFLKSPTVTVVWILMATVFFSALTQINNAFFQGEQRFLLLAGAGMALAILKIPLGLLGVEFDYAVEGALLGLMLAAAITWLIGVALHRGRYVGNATTPETTPKGITLGDVWPVLLANVLMAVMTQLDMVLVNWFFTAEVAGQYAAASVLGKAVLYLSAGVVLSLFPMVVEKHTLKTNITHMLHQALALVALFSGVLAFLYWLIGRWFVALLYGENFTLAGELLRWYGIAIMPMALVMVAEYYLLAQGRLLFVWLFLIFAPIQIIAISVWHENLMQVIWGIGLSGSGLAVIGFLLLWLQEQKSSRAIE
jgi:O-antigen/teichoic acid export membrane protein